MKLALLITLALALHAQQPYVGSARAPNSRDIYEAAPRIKHVVNVSWIYPSDGPALRFEVWRAASPIQDDTDPLVTRVASIPFKSRFGPTLARFRYDNFTFKDDAGLMEGKTHYYRIVAVEDIGGMHISGEITAYIPDPDAPRGVTARVER